MDYFAQELGSEGKVKGSPGRGQLGIGALSVSPHSIDGRQYLGWTLKEKWDLGAGK